VIRTGICARTRVPRRRCGRGEALEVIPVPEILAGHAYSWLANAMRDHTEVTERLSIKNKVLFCRAEKSWLRSRNLAAGRVRLLVSVVA
jgi:hypothetical protein